MAWGGLEAGRVHVWSPGVLLGSRQDTWPRLPELDTPVPPGGCHLQLRQPCTAPTLQATSRSVTLTQDSPAHPSLGGIAPQLPTKAESLFCGWAGDPRVQTVVRDSLAPDVNAVLFAPKRCPLFSRLARPRLPCPTECPGVSQAPHLNTRGTLP